MGYLSVIKGQRLLTINTNLIINVAKIERNFCNKAK